MIDPFHDEPGYLTELPEDLKLRRAEARRRRAWRRRLAAVAVLAVAGAGVAVAVTSVGGGGGKGEGAKHGANQAGPTPPSGETQVSTTTPSYPADWVPH